MTFARDIRRERRWATIHQRGGTVWLTGLPAAGKSTVGAAVADWLIERGRAAYVLDGDVLRAGLNADLDFSPAGRSENVRRTAHAARLLADAGIVTIVCLISPYRADRELARGLHREADLPFLEVFVDTSLSECRRRDPKGLYARADRGEIPNLTGVDDPYEPPGQPDVVVATESLSPDEAAEAVAAGLARLGVLEAASSA